MSINQMRGIREYQGIGRRLLMVDELPQGAYHFERDVRQTAHVVPRTTPIVDENVDDALNFAIASYQATNQPIMSRNVDEEREAIIAEAIEQRRVLSPTGNRNPNPVEQNVELPFNPDIEVQIPTFEIASNPTIHLGGIRSRRFYIVDRDQARGIRRPVIHLIGFDPAKNNNFNSDEREYIKNDPFFIIGRK